MADGYTYRDPGINPLYAVWRNMLNRCNSKYNFKFNKRYSQRGITVCDRWKDYANFREDMIGGYNKDLQIDRIDNDGQYSTENCRWSTPKEQSNNRSSNTYLELDGKRMTVAQWSELAKCKPSTFRQRIYVYKWSLGRALR